MVLSAFPKSPFHAFRNSSFHAFLAMHAVPYAMYLCVLMTSLTCIAQVVGTVVRYDDWKAPHRTRGKGTYRARGMGVGHGSALLTARNPT